METKITFKNPLACVLTKVTFQIEGLGLLNAKNILYG